MPLLMCLSRTMSRSMMSFAEFASCLRRRRARTVLQMIFAAATASSKNGRCEPFCGREGKLTFNSKEECTWRKENDTLVC